MHAHSGADATAHTRYWQQQWLWWDRIEPPLRPHRIDVERMESAVLLQAARSSEPLQALLLGVTPEYAAMRWPERTRLTGVDKSRGMIEHIWPAGVPATARVLQGDWLQLPLPDDSVDVVLGDGFFCQVSYPDDARRLSAEIARVLRPQGVLLQRAFVRLEPESTVDALFRDLEGERLGSFHVFKWRLNMALQTSLSRGVRLGDVWQVFIDRYPDSHELSRRLGYAQASVDTIQAYRDSEARFFYPPLGELLEVLADHFQLADSWYPTYELGERCPHLSLIARGRSARGEDSPR